jgi:hypothetical protein
MSNGAPEIECFSIDPDENLIKIPLPLWPIPRTLGPLPTDLRCEDWNKSVAPKSYRFVTDVNPTLMEQIFHVLKRKRESNIHNHSKANNFG